jgi:predicted site-specific integrase-resolvase
MLSTKDTAERLGAGESSVRLWCEQGRFPNAQKVGWSWIIPESDLKGFEKHKPGPKPARSSKRKGGKLG